MMPSPEALRIMTVISFFALFIVGLRRPVWLAVAYMILILCKLSSYYIVFARTKAELIFAIIIILRLVATNKFFQRISSNYNLVNKYLTFFIISVFLSFAVAWDYQYSWDNAVYHFIKSLVLYILVLVSIKDTKDLKIFIWAFVIIFVYLAYEPMYYFLNNQYASHQIYGVNYIAEIGILSGHVALANNMNQMLPISFYLMLGIKRTKFKFLAGIPLVIFFTALIASGSRGGMLGFLMFSTCIVLYSKRKVRNSLILGGLVVVLFVSSKRMVSTIHRVDEESAWGRLTGLTHGIGILRKGNVLGVGPGCFLFARGKYFHYTMESHNIYGQVLGDLGIPGTIAWFLFLKEVFRNLERSKKGLIASNRKDNFLFKAAMGIEVSLIVRLFVSLGSHGLYYFYWYLMAALSVIVFKLAEKPTQMVEGG